MREIKTEIILASPIERIWSLAADFSLFHHWNPVFTKVAGAPAEGATITITVALPSISPFTLPARIVEIVPRRRIRWYSSYISPLLLRWEYDCHLDTLDGSVRFTQLSRFSGLMAPVFHLALGKPLEDGMERYNLAMKRWGERGNMSCQKC